MKRKVALEIIRIEAATHGKWTDKALRTYVEAHISWAKAQEAVKSGMKQYQRIQQLGG